MTHKMTEQTQTDELPVIAISQCLAGDQVRYDGSHKRSAFCMDKLGKHVRFRPICPEVAIGLPTPRPAIQVQKKGDGFQVISQKIQEDHAPALEAYADSLREFLDSCCGYIFMQKSPSCGVFRTKIYSEKGDSVVDHGPGRFAAKVMEQHPLMPIEEAGRLNDAHLRENFLVRVYCYQRWKQLQANRSKPVNLGELQKFFAEHKYLMMAHSVSHYQKLGRMLANHEQKDPQTIAEEFFPEFILGLKKVATRGHHTNVLQHLQGYLKDFLDSDDKQELAECILKYREGLTPLIAPVTLLKHHARKLDNDYLNSQVYLNPYPEELGLRNTI